MVVYADTSFLFSLYASDINSDAANAQIRPLNRPLLYTSLQNLELRNALRLACFRGEISKAQSYELLTLIDGDKEKGVLVEAQVIWRDVYDLAEELSARYSDLTGNRSLDILHVSIALTLQAEHFWTFDQRQHKLAELSGMEVNKLS